VKLSPSTQIKRLLIGLPLYVNFRARPRRVEDNNDGSSAEGELLHAAVYFARF